MKTGKVNNFVFSGLVTSICFFMLISNAYAMSAPLLDHERPDWWDVADAKIVFSPLLYDDIKYPTIADGLMGYTFTTHFNTIGNPVSLSSTMMRVDLANEENLNKTKLFWVGLHFIGYANSGLGYVQPDETFVDIIGTYNDGSQTETIPFEYFSIDPDLAQDGSGWAYFGASLFPQPLSEEFAILVDTFINGIPLFQIDQIEIGTKCVPIPSAFILFGGGLAGLIGLKRRKQ